MNIHEEQLVQKAAAVAAQAAPAEPEYKAMAAAGLRNHINKYMSLDKHYQAGSTAAVQDCACRQCLAACMPPGSQEESAACCALDNSTQQLSSLAVCIA